LLCLDSWLIGQVARVGTTDEIGEDERGRVIVISLVFNHTYHWNVGEVLDLLNSTPDTCFQLLREYLECEIFCEPYKLHSHIYMSEVEYHLRRIFTASTRTLGQLHTNK